MAKECIQADCHSARGTKFMQSYMVGYAIINLTLVHCSVWTHTNAVTCTWTGQSSGCCSHNKSLGYCRCSEEWFYELHMLKYFLAFVVKQHCELRSGRASGSTILHLLERVCITCRSNTFVCTVQGTQSIFELQHTGTWSLSKFFCLIIISFSQRKIRRVFKHVVCWTLLLPTDAHNVKKQRVIKTF